METGPHPGAGVFVAADVHYLATGGARAAAVVAADAAFSCLAADRIALVPHVEPHQPGQFWRRELPPLRAALDGLDQMALLIIDGYADLDPGGRPGLGARASEESGVRSSAWPSPPSTAPPTPSRRGAGPRPARCTSPPPGCPAPPPPTSSSTWPASTGYPTHCAAPTPSPATAYPSRRRPDTPRL
ncbi:MAG: hypothetical protein ACRDOH_10335 [Streptosporangiaceae bacterium]